MNRQKTIKTETSLSGVGLHTGCKVTMTLKPSGVDSGICFVRVDLPARPMIKANPSSIVKDDSSNVPRCTSIGQGNAVIHTVEHLMSVLCGLDITNLLVELDASELPGLDGSGIEFLKTIQKAGVVEQEAQASCYTVVEPIGVGHNGSSIYIVPSDEFRISYTLDYPHPFLRSQFFSASINSKVYEKEIAPCRTFCLESEANELQSQGLGKGADYSNTLVVGDKGVIDNKTRFPDEFARHKVLDFIGDLYLLGKPLKGHVFAVRSGHQLNIQLLKKIYEQKQRFEKKGIVPFFDLGNKKEIRIDEIMSILPHRYPFLLVDRVIEIEKGKKAVGIKNVTINDSFFQGHFPTRPVMPGVLMVEAMAQTAGVVVLTNEAHRGKVAFFMAVDKVKFRRVVVPGDQLLMEVEVLRDRSKTAQIQARAKVGDDVVAEAEMVFSFAEASYLD